MKNIRSIQEKLLSSLIKKAGHTSFGQKYHFDKITSYEEFKKRVPLQNYDNIKSEIERIKALEADVLWPEIIDRFAVSSGTTGDGKHLPLSNDRLASDKRFMKKVILSHLARNPSPALFCGYHVSLPGSIEEIVNVPPITLGEISGFLSLMTPTYLRPFQVVPPNHLAEMPWKPKFSLCLDRALQKDVRVISAVPSWTLIFLQQALNKTGHTSIQEIWPNLRLFVCGGAALDSYRESILDLCQGLSVKFIETYGASEGYFGYTDDRKGTDMRLVIDNGIFFEWIPYYDYNSDQTEPIPTWQVQTGEKYILCVSTNAGLWRYIMNDVILFTKTNPPRIRVIGRVSDMLDLFGEALTYQEATTALERVLSHNDISCHHFIIGSLLSSPKNLPRHYWFIISDTNPENTTELSGKIDDNIRKINRHYAIRRESGALDFPKLIFISNEKFIQWFEKYNPSKAQTKMPKILHHEAEITSLIEFTEKTKNVPEHEN